MNRNPPHYIGEKNPAWKGGRSKHGDSGYIMLTAFPKDHKFSCMAMKNGQVLEHRIVMAEKLGRPLTRKEVVHHIDGNKSNNHPDNLELFGSQQEHVQAERDRIFQRLSKLEKENEELKIQISNRPLGGMLSAATLRKIRPLEPFLERSVINGKSYGLSIAGYDIRLAQGYCLEPGEFILGSSIEHFMMPRNVLGLVKDKSTWARQGLSVFNTCLEPGWIGYLTLELKNLGNNSIMVCTGDPIAQVLFYFTDEVTDGYSGKYQYQESGPQEARYETNEIAIPIDAHCKNCDEYGHSTQVCPDGHIPV
jgi:dCTP deaminase